MDPDADLSGILSLLRRHVEIRNRSWMKRIHRDCFIGSEAVDFLCTQGLADTRDSAVVLLRGMAAKNLICKVTDTIKNFSDSYHYYRFKEDESAAACLGNCNAGNNTGNTTGQGGCKWSFAPHTAHNSYILDVGLAEEIERAVAGASVEARLHAFRQLRQRVREQAEEGGGWMLSQSTEVNNTKVSVYQRKRPRGDWANVKMTGMAGETPVGFIQGIMNFSKRRQWEGMFEDGVTVEAIDLGEPLSALLQEDADENVTAQALRSADPDTAPLTPPMSPLPVCLPQSQPPPAVEQGGEQEQGEQEQGEQGGKGASRLLSSLQRKTDDVNTFLQTVDVAAVPQGMAIAFLNDPERQHALSHLRKMMMASNPRECMLCNAFFNSNADIRCCPCCAMVSCASCVCKRVFETVSRQTVSVCVHCYRESSRIRQPPQVVVDARGVKESIRGKWWRPEDLGMVDHSQQQQQLTTSSEVLAALAPAPPGRGVVGGEGGEGDGLAGSLYNEEDCLIMTSEIKPLVPGLLDGLGMEEKVGGSETKRLSLNPFPMLWGRKATPTLNPFASRVGGQGQGERGEEGEGEDDDGEGVRDITQDAVDDFDDGIGNLGIDDMAMGGFSPVSAASPTNPASGVAEVQAARGGGGAGVGGSAPPKTARCKKCGLLISRSMDAIEAHIEECGSAMGRKNSSVADGKSYILTEDGTAVVGAAGSSKAFGGISRNTQLDAGAGTRIIYRTARKQGGNFVRPREVCALQDSFVDEEGCCYVYEISVRHSDVLGMADYVTADVMMLMHVAKPIPGSSSLSQITIMSQINTHSRRPQWLQSFMGTDGSSSRALGRLHKDDLVRELRLTGNLQNILKREKAAAGMGAGGAEDGPVVSLEDFDLLAVLGRGGFGKVMQVRHRTTDTVYAMKILKKSELRRRRQVERTQTERTILANVRHPFIVCLHYAFQSPQKLYMVMDFVQGGDFFTLMRKFKRIPEEWVRLYVMEVAMALQHLHDMDVVYRDLKPENILLCSDGHLKLTDFGLSRFFETRPPAPEDMLADDNIVTRSFCGTEQYMSPEMLLQQGHNYRMDWWCLGLLMHEMVSARHPFHGPTHYDTLRNMVTKPPTVDPRLSPGASAVVKHLLVKNPRTRLCCKGGTLEMKNIPYFQVVDWDALLERRIEMPYKPRLVGETDVSSFETTFTRERPIDSTPDSVNSTSGKKIKSKGGILGLFGIGAAVAGGGVGKKGDADADAFKDFSFAKEEAVGGGGTGVVGAGGGVGAGADVGAGAGKES